MKKLYIIIREDLAPGLMLAQVAHGAIAFSLVHDNATREWNASENNIAVLGARGEDHLEAIFAELEVAGVRTARFYEPDVGDALTCVAAAGEQKAIRLLRHLPPALAPTKAA